MQRARQKTFTGPAILSYGFRTFFLAASLYAGLSILLWLPQFQGHLQLNTSFAPVDWHIHEMLFGFVAAVISGFLFTAVPNWTGRMPIRGIPLLCLFVVWLAGRIAVTYSMSLGWVTAMIIDCLFLAAIWGSIAIEIIAGKNWRNLKVLMPLTILFFSNVYFHVEAHEMGVSDVSQRVGLMAVIAFILLIGGRIVPSFTRNWLAKNNPGKLPKSFAFYEKACLGICVISMVFWIILPDSLITAVMLIGASVLLIGQLLRWVGYRTFKEPLVTVLHISYLFIPVGFFLLGAAIVWSDYILPITGIHALGTGAVGGMILSVMVRATKGHTGQSLQSTRMDNLLFGVLFTSAVARILSTFGFAGTMSLLHFSGLLWAIAFLGFAFVYGKCLGRKTV